MIDQLWESLLQFATNVVFLAGQGFAVAGEIIAIPGFIGLAIGITLFVIAYKKTKNLIGALLLLLGSGITIYIIVSFLLWPFLFKGSANSVTSCYKAAGTNQAAIKVCDTVSRGFIPPTTPGEQTPVVIVPPADPDDQQVVRTFKANALEILTLGWNLKPPGASSNLVKPANVPQGLMVFFECDNPIAARKNEIWKVTVSGNVPGLGQKTITLETNGYFARDGFDAKPGTSVAGTGSWEQACSSCYTDVVVTPPPQPTPAPAPTTQVAFPELICGYWGWLFQSGNALVVPTTGGQPDFAHAVSQAAAAADIAKRCPDEALPAPP